MSYGKITARLVVNLIFNGFIVTSLFPIRCFQCGSEEAGFPFIALISWIVLKLSLQDSSILNKGWFWQVVPWCFSSITSCQCIENPLEELDTATDDDFALPIFLGLWEIIPSSKRWAELLSWPVTLSQKAPFPYEQVICSSYHFYYMVYNAKYLYWGHTCANASGSC